MNKQELFEQIDGLYQSFVAAHNGTTKKSQAQARKQIEGDVFFEFDIVIRDQTTNTGEFYVELSSATSSALVVNPVDKFVYDLEMTLNSETRRLIEGNVTIKREVTR